MTRQRADYYTASEKIWRKEKTVDVHVDDHEHDNGDEDVNVYEDEDAGIEA